MPSRIRREKELYATRERRGSKRWLFECRRRVQFAEQLDRRGPPHIVRVREREREREEEREKGRIRRDGRVKNAESCERRRGMCVYKTSEVGRAREYVAAAGAELYRLSEHLEEAKQRMECS